MIEVSMMKETDKTNKPIIQPDLIFLDLNCKTSEEVIRQLGQIFEDRGLVKTGFVQSILKREKEYPTGLPTGGAAVAIPHTNADFVLKSAMITAILANPVPFHNMADPDESLPVQIVFMLAIKEPTFQVVWLKQLMGLLRKPGQLQKMLELNDVNKIANFLNEAL
jgi:galactitol PTS system EIIA component